MAGALPSPDPKRLLAWYDVHKRALPWRASRDPYRIWLSEVMAQQTTLAAVIPYYQAFLARWPRLADLAAAEPDEVLAAWSGLGYYRRARHLHACARIVARDLGGRFPESVEGLRALPGLGAYSAAAIAAIAFERPTVPVDGNVLRVVARLFAVTKPLAQAKAELAARAQTLRPRRRFGDFAQALMELGALVCTPRAPDCPRCPWAKACRARAQGIADSLPRKSAKKAKPMLQAVAFLLRRADGAVLLHRRPDTGLLAGMLELPSTPWREKPWSLDDALAYAPPGQDWTESAPPFRHVFSHVSVTMRVLAGRSVGRLAGLWAKPGQWDDLALPSLTAKALGRTRQSKIY